ncbi:tetratricopeptide repeat protein [Pinirhizobacter sp.]|uniref:tetratricopeptide repeat protein n=1 Tax=Pinirhizobacter sp. TaxID=2950432 RepID=UPI002F4261F2
MHLRGLAIGVVLAGCGGGHPAPAPAAGSDLAAQAEAAYNAPDLTRSFPLAKQACDANSAFGCTLLGLHYQDARGAPWDHPAAVAAYEKACALGDGTGCFNLESMYRGGHGVTVDNKIADELHAKARAKWQAQCDGGEPRRCVNVAYLVSTDGPPTADSRARVYALDKQACDAGDPEGCGVLPRAALEAGKLTAAEYVAQSDAQCTKGIADACLELGATLKAGDGERGVAQDAMRGTGLLHRACSLGSPAGCYWAEEYEAACDRGYAQGCAAMAAKEVDQARAAELAKRGCQGGDAASCELIARDYRLGHGVTHDDATAITWAREACSMGRPAMCGILMMKGLELPVPPEALPALYKSACDSGVSPACSHVSK